MLLLREIKARLGIADLLAACLPDECDPERVTLLQQMELYL